MKIQHLISAMNAEPEALIEKMNIKTDAVLINQCQSEYSTVIDTEFGRINVYSYNEKGVGVSRNHALDHADGDIILFSDEDIVYFDGYTDIIADEFNRHPEADGLFFNVKVCDERRTYYNENYGKCHIWNAGRYPAYSIALRKSSTEEKNLCFSTLFGGGAKYACGEDSIFIKDCLKAGLKMYRTTALIGEEIPRPSTWFKGFDDKFFFDRGVMYHFLYGKLAAVMGARFVFTKRGEMCKDIPAGKAFSLLRQGIREGKAIDK